MMKLWSKVYTCTLQLNMLTTSIQYIYVTIIVTTNFNTHLQEAKQGKYMWTVQIFSSC